MPEKRWTAQEEMMRRIKALDAEEDYWVTRAEQCETDRIAATSEAKKIGNTRRQYEYALHLLGVDPPEDPKPKPRVTISHLSADPVEVKVNAV